MMHAAPEHPYRRGWLEQPVCTPLRPGGPALTRQLIARAGFGAGDRVLDLGCGCGEGTALLRTAGCTPIGLDTDVGALVQARQRHPELAWVQADGASLPFASGSLDGVLAECSLSLMPARQRVLAECRRLLPCGARLALSDICRRGEAEPDSSGLPGCLAGMTTSERLQEDLAMAGFAVEQSEDHSEVLKALVATLIFSSGSLAALWAPTLSAADAAAGSAALRAARPGYFLYLARAI